MTRTADILLSAIKLSRDFLVRFLPFYVETRRQIARKNELGVVRIICGRYTTRIYWVDKMYALWWLLNLWLLWRQAKSSPSPSGKPGNEKDATLLVNNLTFDQFIAVHRSVTAVTDWITFWDKDVNSSCHQGLLTWSDKAEKWISFFFFEFRFQYVFKIRFMMPDATIHVL